MTGFCLEEISEILQTIHSTSFGGILVGGQAVNAWVHQYHQESQAWERLRPYSSIDLDYHGGIVEANIAAKALHAKAKLNDGTDPSPNAAVLQVATRDDRVILIDILTTVFGVSASEVQRTAVQWHADDLIQHLTLRVIHPILLLESKLACFRGLPQATRQDEKHVRLLVLVLSMWFKTQLDRPRDFFRAAERLGDIALSPDGLSAAMKSIDILEAIPHPQTLAGDPAYSQFLEIRLPQIFDQIRLKRQLYLDAL